MTSLLSLPTMPTSPDTLLALHTRNVASYSGQILEAVADAEHGVATLDRVIDRLPDALEAVRANPLSRDASEAIHALAGELMSLAAKLQGGAAHMARLSTYGLRHLVLSEARLAELRHLGDEEAEVLGDQSTCYADDSEPSDAERAA
jgi:hypothetical protein